MEVGCAERSISPQCLVSQRLWSPAPLHHAVKPSRGRSTINIADSDSPMIVVDGARVSDFSALRDLPCDAISSIEILSGISGTVSQGTNASAGVIYIHTWEASGGS